jgi:hypothetical protein
MTTPLSPLLGAAFPPPPLRPPERDALVRLDEEIASTIGPGAAASQSFSCV